MKTYFLAIVHIALAMISSPLFVGIINRTKAILVGRTGQSNLQPYFDIAKLIRKGAVYSRTTSWVFRAGRVINLSVLIFGLFLIPYAGTSAVLAFDGDWIVLAYALGLARFFIVLSALDTGSSFEGMGASREVTFSILVEPTLFVGLFALSRLNQSMSLNDILYTSGVTDWSIGTPALVATTLFILYLVENSRIPFDDPTTHLELTMIHEVMVLDHGGPDFGLVLYGSTMKLWLFGAIFIGVFSPNLTESNIWLREGFALFGMIILAIAVGIVETSMARVRLLKIPQILIGAGVLAILSVILVLE